MRRIIPHSSLQALLDSGAALVDVRPAAVYDGFFPAYPELAGHIPGAVNLPLNTLTDKETAHRLLADLGLTDKLLVLYCNCGVTSAKAAVALESCGVDKTLISTYDGGMEEWIARGGRVEKS